MLISLCFFFSFKVLVTLFEMEDVCSVASNREKYQQEVTVWPQNASTVPFIILPMNIGERHIEVKAAVKDSPLSDGMVKVLQVQVGQHI